MTNAKSLYGKTFIVSGGASGMGAAVVDAYARAGARVTAFFRHESGNSVLNALPPEDAARVTFLYCDVSNKSSVDAAFAQAVASMGGLDGLVHAAAIAPNATAEDITLEGWEQVFAINARGTFLTNQIAFPYLKDRGGRILNFASATGVTGTIGKAHYAASKGAVLAWTRSIAREWARYKISANAIAPAIWTPMYDKTRASMSSDALQAHNAAMRQAIPLGGKLGNVADFAPFMVFLAGDGARFITGQTLKIDGGMLML